MTDSKTLDVIAVQIASPHAERVMERGLTPENAEAFIKIAVARRGVDTEFYTTRPSRCDGEEQDKS